MANKRYNLANEPTVVKYIKATSSILQLVTITTATVLYVYKYSTSRRLLLPILYNENLVLFLSRNPSGIWFLITR